MKWMRLFGLVTLMTIAPLAVANDPQQLQQLLHDFLANTVNDDLKNHERFWSNDLIYTSSSGTRFDKNKIIRDIKEAAGTQEADSSSPTYSAEETDIRLHGRTAIVAFKLVATWVEDNEEKEQLYFNTGTFLKRKGLWEAVAWQATKIPDELAK